MDDRSIEAFFNEIPEPETEKKRLYADDINVAVQFTEIRLHRRIPGNHDLEHLAEIHKFLTQKCMGQESLPRTSNEKEILLRDGKRYSVEYANPSLFGEIADELADDVALFKKAAAAKDKNAVVDTLADMHQVLSFAHYLKSYNETSIAAFMIELGRDSGINMTLESTETIARRRDCAIDAQPCCYEQKSDGTAVQAGQNTDILYAIYDRAVGKRWPEQSRLDPEDIETLKQNVEMWQLENSAQSVAQMTFIEQSGEEKKQRPIFYEKEIYRMLLQKAREGEDLLPSQKASLFSDRASWIMGTELPNQKMLERLLFDEQTAKQSRGFRR